MAALTVIEMDVAHQRRQGEQAPNKHRDEQHAGFGGSRDDPFNGSLM
jgi:hypothetical protein